MSTPRINEDLTVIEHLDFDVQCDYDHCDREAVWLASYHGEVCRCPHEYFYCDPCKRSAESWFLGRHGRVECLTCGTKWQSIVIDRIEPLR